MKKINRRKIPKKLYSMQNQIDGSGIDVWKGTDGDFIDAIICTVDLLKRDSEIKILIGCSEEEKQMAIPDNEYMKGILIRRNTK